MKPMLAATTDGQGLKYPLLASPKLDGVRCVIQGGMALSRTLKPIPNKHIQAVLGQLPEVEGLDGELIVGEPTASDCYRATMSAVMRAEGAPDFTFYVFDLHGTCGQFSARLNHLQRLYLKHKTAIEGLVVPLAHHQVTCEVELAKYERQMLELGYEGIMLRSPTAHYKFGRSTLKEQGMLKLKRFEDSEAVVICIAELMHNENARIVNELGSARRTSHKAGKVGASMLGALTVKDLVTGVQFEVGTGFLECERMDIWEQHQRHELVGRVIKYKHFPVGVKDKPRHPVFLGFRDDIDIGEPK